MQHTKPDRLIPGLRRLSATQRHGQSFTTEEIAQACGCDRKNISYIETRALKKFISSLHEKEPKMLEEIFGKAEVVEVLAKAAAPRAELRSFRKNGRPMAA